MFACPGKGRLETRYSEGKGKGGAMGRTVEVCSKGKKLNNCWPALGRKFDHVRRSIPVAMVVVVVVVAAAAAAAVPLSQPVSIEGSSGSLCLDSDL